MLQAYGIQHKQ